MINKKLLTFVLLIATLALKSADISDHQSKQIAGYKISTHCLQRMTQRKISDVKLEQVLQNGKWSSQDATVWSVFFSDEHTKIKAVINKTENVIVTVCRSDKKTINLNVAKTSFAESDEECDNTFSKSNHAKTLALKKKHKERKNNLPSKYPHKSRNTILDVPSVI